MSCDNSYCLHKLQRCAPVITFNDCYPQRIVCQYICERVHVRRIDTLTSESCLIVCTAMFNEKPSLIPLINS